MAKVRNIVKLLWGLFLGNSISFIILLRYASTVKNVCLNAGEPKIYQQQRSEKTGSKDISLIMVGVMTAPKYFDTRAKAVYQTWGKEIPGDIRFYSSQGSYSNQIPLIALNGVDDSYPPQKKSLMMLKHMHDNYINSYEWFMRADDDVYVRPDRLEELLRSVDSRKIWFIGQTGRGNSEEFGLLSLDTDENFCMGGPGVIFSRETLKKVAPYVEECLRHLYTSHEDVELGRCVRRFAGVSCTWSYQASDCDCKMQVIFYHNQSGNSSFTGDLKQKEIHQAITLHPVKQSEHLYRLHNYFKGLKIQKNQHDSLNLQRDLVSSMTTLGYQNQFPFEASTNNNASSPMAQEAYLKSWNLGIPASITKYPSNSLENICEWEFISGSLYSHNDLNPKRRIGTSLKEGLSDVIVEVMEHINNFSKQRGRLIEFKEIMYAYWRLNPLYGVEYILDLLLVYRKYRGHKMTIQVRRHAYIQQSFSALYLRDIDNYAVEAIASSSDRFMPVHSQIKYALMNLHKNLEPYFKFGNQNEETTINFILPLSGRFKVFERFMRIYENICLIPRENTALYIILYEDTNNSEDTENTKSLIRDLQNTYYGSKILILHKSDRFSRGRALQYGVDMLNDLDLMFFIDVDMVFEEKTLARIRINSARNKSIYFPIVYSFYSPKLLNKTFNEDQYLVNSMALIDQDNGFWRQFGFGIVSLYKSDYLNIGGFNLLITGWGFEDVMFYDKVVKSHLQIVRCTDPSLFHIYHPIHCDDNLDNTQKQMCIGTEAGALGSLDNLQKTYINYKNLFKKTIW